MLKEYLEKLLQELGMTDKLPLEEHEVYEVPFEPGLVIMMKEQKPGFYFYSSINPCPLRGKEQLFIKLMEANFLGQGTDQGVLGLEENMTITLFNDISEELDYRHFRDRLEDFINYVDYWKHAVKKHEQEGEKILMEGAN